VVLYFANPTGNRDVHRAMSAGQIGYIATPNQGNRRPEGATWIADNGCFSTNYVGDAQWFSWLRARTSVRESCWFATAPDVVGDAAATLERSLPWLPRIRELGYPAALVAQDGLERLDIPWAEFDVLFVGGTTDWKMGAFALQIVREAQSEGKRVHFGRVNSLLRYRYAQAIGAQSVDGTYLTFGPSVNLPRLLGWVDTIGSTPSSLDRNGMVV
jgi:hypothetical protein